METKNINHPHEDFASIKIKNRKEKRNADIFSYVLDWQGEKHQGELVGSIQNNSVNPLIYIPIFVNDNYMAKCRQNNMFFTYDGDGKACIVMASRFLSNIKENPALLALIWHEVGHYHTFQYFEAKDYDRVRKERYEYLDKNEIMPEEKAADLFAAMYSFSEPVIQGINFLISERRKLNDPNMYLAIRELSYRKKYIKRFEGDDEQIEKELFKICSEG